jgi:mRNA-degrading endonuclease toxin of MazEF toxin-antitoxin module
VGDLASYGSTAFAPGDVVWGFDAYHHDDPLLRRGTTRPWIIVSNERYPRFGEQYLCCALTTRSRSTPSLLALQPTDWERGGTPKRSSIDTGTIVTLKQRWIADYSGRVAATRLFEARERLKS